MSHVILAGSPLGRVRIGSFGGPGSWRGNSAFPWCICLCYNPLRTGGGSDSAPGIAFAEHAFGAAGRGPGRPDAVFEQLMVGLHEPSYSILVADDDRASRDTLRDIIDPLGYRTLLAEDGAEALEIVQQEIIHVALFDVHMPKLTGLETLEMIRQFNPLLPVILITADSSAGLMRQAFQAHAYSVLPKPVNKNIVLQTLTRALGRAYRDPDSLH
jgi:CheY-like chemotaxis protein